MRAAYIDWTSALGWGATAHPCWIGLQLVFGGRALQVTVTLAVRMSITIRPRKLAGPWTVGYALDFQTISSTFIGYNAFGHPEFDTKRPPVGELLYQLKNRGDATAIPVLAEAAATFIKDWPLDIIVPIPPSNTARKRQPVIEVAGEISNRTGIRLCATCIRKVKNTGQLKDVFDRAKREQILAGAFSADRQQTEARRILLFDDLYRSGATAAAVTRLLLGDGAAAEVYLLTLTQTRKNL
jgi:competence protein ComFC